MKQKSAAPPKKNVKVNNSKKSEIFEVVDNFLKKRSTIILFILLFIELLTSYLLFDLKMNPGGDDSAYILNAFNFIHNNTYPGQFEGALYPFFLSIFIKFFGVNIPVLKTVSFVCMLLFFIVFYFSYKNSIPRLLLFSVILLLALNYHLLYYASQTFTEAFFLIIQASLFLIINKFFLNKEESTSSKFLPIVLLGFVLFLLTMSKNVGLGCFISVIAFLLLIWRWKDALFVSGSFGAFYFLYEGLKRMLWPQTNFQIQSQGTGLLYKDFYNPSQGYEDFSGLVDRFVSNSNTYISRDFYTILGLRNEIPVLPFLTILTYCFFLIMIYVLFKKNKSLLFTGVYAGIMSCITFIAVQKTWEQERLILIFVPYFLIFFLGGIYYSLKKINFGKIQVAFFIVVGILLLTTFTTTSKVIEVKRSEFVANSGSNPYKGFNEGMANFIKMSKWVSENKPKDKIVLSRKAEISFAYTGRKFFPIHSIPNISSDSLLNIVKNDTQSVYCSIQYKDFFANIQTNEMYNIYQDYQRYYVALIKCWSINEMNQNLSAEYQVFRLPKDKAAELILNTSVLKIPVSLDIKTLLTSSKKISNDLRIYQPDVSLNWLKQNKISSIILANFALSTSLKPEKIQYNSTIQNFLRPIELKYPSLLTISHIIGSNEENCSKLIEVDYSKLPQQSTK